MNYQIYVKRRVYAVVNNDNNYALCIEFEEPDGGMGFRQDGSWVPVRFNAAPSWLKEQIKEFEEFESES